MSVFVSAMYIRDIGTPSSFAATCVTRMIFLIWIFFALPEASLYEVPVPFQFHHETGEQSRQQKSGQKLQPGSALEKISTC